MDIDDLTPEQQELLKAIQARRKVVVREHRLKKGAANNQAIVPRRNDPRRISNTANMKASSLLSASPLQSFPSLCLVLALLHRLKRGAINSQAVLPSRSTSAASPTPST